MSKKFLLIALLVCIQNQYLLSQRDSIPAKKLTFSADTRLRLEYDWDRMTADGIMNADRARMRFRFRFGFDYQWSTSIRFGARMRSGDPEDQQSPHWTLGKEFEVYSFKIDKVYIAGKHQSFWWWAGKNNYPFWKQNELFWDDDVVPEGFSCGLNLKLDEQLTLNPAGGLFISNSAGSFFDDDGLVYIGQLAGRQQLKYSTLNFASGIYLFHNINDLNQKPLDSKIDYNIWITSAQIHFKEKNSFKAGFDLIYNFKSLEEYAWITETNLENEKLAWVATLSFGELSDRGDLQLGYSYAHIPKYALVDYFAQDDWTSWSFPENTPGTRSSNFKGHEFQAAYAFGPSFNVVTRLYLVNGLKKNDTQAASLESANRFRVDLNIGF